MRILTVRQPWAWAIIHGGKNVENRVRNIAGDYRGPVAIHAGQQWDPRADPPVGVLAEAMDRSRPLVVRDEWPWGVFGAIIGVVDLTDVHSASVIDGCGSMDNHCPDHPHGCRHHCSPWAMGPAPEGWYQHLVLANPRALDQPIPFRGALGLRKTNFFVSGDWLGEYIDPGHSACTPYGCPPSCYSEPVARLVATS